VNPIESTPFTPRRGHRLAQAHLVPGLALVICAVSGMSVHAQGVPDAPREVPMEKLQPRVERFPAKSLQEVQEAFEVAPGFALELVAAEPLVTSPVAMQFDARGSLWVVEMVDYSEQETEALGRVSRLEDRDGDGRMDHSQVVADRLSWPTAIACLERSVWIAAPPLVVQADASMVAESSSESPAETQASLPIVLQGLGRQNVQGMANSFRWGLDGRLHLSTSSNGGQVSAPEASPVRLAASPLSVAGRDIAVDLRTGAVSTIVGYGQHGMDFSPWGDRFVTSNSDHLQQVVAWYLPELTDASLSRGVAWRRSISVDGPQAEVYRSSPVESWRSIRTQMRLSGASIGLLEGNGRASGYFTSATGVTLYDGDQWPERDEMVALVADVGSNLVHRKRLRPQGAGLVGERLEHGTEFVRSRDTWFRPVQMANGPDGCLYIVDMARETIEHPRSLPEPIKSQVDLTSGRNLGRIWRVRSTERPIRRGAVSISDRTPRDWIDLLSHPNGWHRETASQLLIQYPVLAEAERGRLREVARSHSQPLARLHALSVLASIPKGLDIDTWEISVRDPHPKLRVWGLVFATRVSEPISPERAQGVFESLRQESESEVLIAALVRSASLIPDPEKRAALLMQWIRDDWSLEEHRAAFEVAIRGPAAKRLWGLLEERFSDPKLGREVESWVDGVLYSMHLAGDLAECITQRSNGRASSNSLPVFMASVARLLEQRAVVEGSATYSAVQQYTRDHLAPRLRASLAQHDLAAEPTPKKQDSTDASVEWSSAVRWLASLPVEERRAWLLQVLDDSRASELHGMAIEAWVGNDVVMQKALVERIDRLSPTVVQSVLKVLVRNESGAGVLLDQVEGGGLGADRVPAWIWQALRFFPNEAIRARASRWDQLTEVPWDSIAESYKKGWAMPGNAEAGANHFKKWCAACHRIGDIGIAIGPALESYRVRTNEAIALAVAEPSREMDPKYEQHQIRTDEGHVHVGILVSSNAEQVVLRTAQNEMVTVSREEIEQWKSTGRSLMPDGLLKELDPMALNDLIAFLRYVP
jgi:putative membrane-bound dehydrogenase-like protein